MTIPAFPTCAHGDRPRRALGLCQACYSRWRRTIEKDRITRLIRAAATQRTGTSVPNP